MSRMKTVLGAVGLAAAAALTVAGVGPADVLEARGAPRAAATTCPALPQGGESVTLDPAAFTTTIDNPYLPLRPGTRWVYRDTDPDGTRRRVTVTVTHQTKRIANGILARVVRDTVTEGGVPVEDTFDWYAQDRAGNVWYLGELTREFEDGVVVSTEGSFEAGVDGAQAGIAMPANPRAGCAYRQEHYPGHAEDRAEVLSRREQAQVPLGHYDDVVTTRDLNALEPRVLEHKFYARGVGLVLAVGISGGSDREELVRLVRP